MLTAAPVKPRLNKRRSSPEILIYYLMLERFTLSAVCLMLSVDDTEPAVFRNVPDTEQKTQQYEDLKTRELSLSWVLCALMRKGEQPCANLWSPKHSFISSLC